MAYDRETVFQGFEAEGEATVRDRVSRFAYNEEMRALAVQWLALRDQSERESSRLSSLEARRIARSEKNAAWIAAIAAIIVAACTIIIYLLSRKT